MTIKDLNPQIVWNNFYGLTQIPRPSKHEEKVIEYLYNWGKEHGIETIKDETGNIIMRKPATPGFENRRGVILQGHMDMVPQKTGDSTHDFLRDPIRTEIVGEWVGAKGTTLGADNGIGVAMAMAVMEDDSLRHGPVEVLITYDEETGMTGAGELKPGMFKGDIFLNLDSESEGELCIGCAGGLDGTADFRYRTYRTPEGLVAYKLTVKGLAGGHSGMDISLYRANANKIVARVVNPLVEKYGVKVADIKGGSLRNAIPYEGEAVVLVKEADVKAVKAEVASILAEVKAEHSYSDPEAEFHFEKAARCPERYIQDSVIRRALKAIIACPHGVARMSDSMPGLTETSTNLAIVKCEKGHLKVQSLMRSAVDSSKANLAEQLRAVFELAGAEFTTAGGYNGWTPKPETPVYDVVKRVWKEMTGTDMKVMATHGGLECALLGAKYPSWEMVSIGPDIVHPHSPDERVRIESVAKVWEFLKKLLEEVPEK